MFDFFRILGAAHGDTQVKIADDINAGRVQSVHVDHRQRSIGRHTRDFLTPQKFGGRLGGGRLAIAGQAARRRELGWTGHLIGPGVRSGPLHFDIAQDQRCGRPSVLDQFDQDGRIAHDKTNAMVEGHVVGRNAGHDRGMSLGHEEGPYWPVGWPPYLARTRARELLRLIVLIHQNHSRFVFPHFGFVVPRVAGDDHQIALLDQVCRCPVDADLAGSSRPGNGVRRQTGSIGDIQDVHLLVHDDVGRVHQILVDRDAPLVVQIGVSDRGPVNLRFQERSLHEPDSLATETQNYTRRSADRTGARSETVA